MHSVSQDWVDEQEKQLRDKVDVNIAIFNLTHTPKYVSFNDRTNQKVFCKEIMACESLFQADWIEFVFDPFDFDFDNEDWEVEGDGDNDVEIYDDHDNLIYSGRVDDLGGELFNITKMHFTSNQNDWKLQYFIFGKVYWLYTNSIEQLNYVAHCSVLNRDLPYHKITFTTLEKSIPLNGTVVAYVDTGFEAIDEYIPLGCGYYYLDKRNYKNDGFRQQYSFVDILSTLTDKCRISNGNNYYYGYLVEKLLDQHTNQYFNYQIPNVDLTNLNYVDETMNAYRSSVYERTIAEALQLVAQASGLTLYVNEKNQIAFKKMTYLDHNIENDTNDVWILKKPQFDKSEPVKTLTINAMQNEIAQSAFNEGGIKIYDIEIGNFKSVSGQTKYLVEFNGIYTGANASSGSIIQWTQNYVVVEQTTPNTTVSITCGYSWSAPKVMDSRKYTVSANGSDNAVLNLELGYRPLWDDVMKHYVYWLEKNETTYIETRFDAKYFLLDCLYNVYGNYGIFVVEDINATLCGGFTGSFKGRSEMPVLMPPLISFTSTSVKIVNPNDYEDVALYFSNGSSESPNIYYMKPNETLTILYSNDSWLSIEYTNYINNNYQSDVVAYFTDDGSGDRCESKKVRVFGGN